MPKRNKFATPKKHPVFCLSWPLAAGFGARALTSSWIVQTVNSPSLRGAGKKYESSPPLTNWRKFLETPIRKILRDSLPDRNVPKYYELCTNNRQRFCSFRPQLLTLCHLLFAKNLVSKDKKLFYYRWVLIFKPIGTFFIGNLQIEIKGVKSKGSYVFHGLLSNNSDTRFSWNIYFYNVREVNTQWDFESSMQSLNFNIPSRKTELYVGKREQGENLLVPQRCNEINKYVQKLRMIDDELMVRFRTMWSRCLGCSKTP